MSFEDLRTIRGEAFEPTIEVGRRVENFSYNQLVALSEYLQTVRAALTQISELPSEGSFQVLKEKQLEPATIAVQQAYRQAEAKFTNLDEKRLLIMLSSWVHRAMRSAQTKEHFLKVVTETEQTVKTAVALKTHHTANPQAEAAPTHSRFLRPLRNILSTFIGTPN